MVIVTKLYPCYHQDGLEFIFSYPHSVAASMACTVVRHTGIVSCGLKQILGETSAHIENLLTVLLYSSLNQHQCLKKKKSQYAAACLQTEHNVHVFTECKKYPIYFTRLYLQATRHFPLSWEFGDSLQMILSFTRHENKFGPKTGRFLAEFFFHSALCNYQCKPGPMSLAVKKKELIKIVPQSFVQGVWP